MKQKVRLFEAEGAVVVDGVSAEGEITDPDGIVPEPLPDLGTRPHGHDIDHQVGPGLGNRCGHGLLGVETAGQRHAPEEVPLHRVTSRPSTAER